MICQRLKPSVKKHFVKCLGEKLASIRIKNVEGEAEKVLSDVWVNPLFSFCLTKPIWWLIANQKIREYPKYRKNLSMGFTPFFAVRAAVKTEKYN